MARRPGPTLRAQWLGKRLRELREADKKTLRQAGEYLQRNLSMIGRFESGEYPIRRVDLLALLDFYGVSDEKTRTNLLRQSEDVWRKDGWERFAGTVDHEFIDYPWLESRAERICSYDVMVVPGLLQTRDYAEVVIRTAEGAAATDERVASWIELRLARQQILDADHPPQVSTILDESILRRPVGGVPVLKAQLVHLIELACRPTIDIRVLALSSGAHAGIDGPFTLLEMSEPYPDVAYMDNLGGRLYIEMPDAERFARAYDRLQVTALNERASVALIKTVLEGLDDKRTGAPQPHRSGKRGVAHQHPQ